MRRFFITIAILLTCLGAQAQKEAIRLGFELSPQVSWLMSDDDKVDSDGLLGGYNFGLMIDRFFAPNYAFTTGFFINTTGGKLLYEDGADIVIGNTLYNDKHQLTYRLKYLDIPIGVKLMTNEMARNRFYIQMGFTNQFLIKTNDGSGKNIKEEVRFYNIGYQLGGGLEHSMGGNLFLRTGLLFGSSFNDVTSNATYDDRTVMRKLVLSAALIF